VRKRKSFLPVQRTRPFYGGLSRQKPGHSGWLAGLEDHARVLLYLIGVDGHIAKRVGIVCDDDEEAKGLAKQMVDGHAIEL
jgi:hypothetical protein